MIILKHLSPEDEIQAEQKKILKITVGYVKGTWGDKQIVHMPFDPNNQAHYYSIDEFIIKKMNRSINGGL